MSSTIKNVLCKTCLILIIGFTFLTVSHAHAQPQIVDLRVDGDNGIPAGDGLTWATAFQFLQDALTEAASIADPDTTGEEKGTGVFFGGGRSVSILVKNKQ